MKLTSTNQPAGLIKAKPSHLGGAVQSDVCDRQRIEVTRIPGCDSSNTYHIMQSGPRMARMPIPTIGFSAEIPCGNFLFSTQIGAFYFDSGNFEGLGIRAIAGAVWRPYEHVGFFAGLKAIYVDLELKNEVVDNLTLWGPAVGLEFRF